MAIDVVAAVGERGWITRPDLLTSVSRQTVDVWVARGKLVRLQPGVFALPSAALDWRTRIAAALAVRKAGVASHVTALALWELVEHPPGPVHITVDLNQSWRGTTGLAVHRSVGVHDERRRVEGSRSPRSSAPSWTPGEDLPRCAGRTCGQPSSVPSADGCARPGTFDSSSIVGLGWQVGPNSPDSSACCRTGARANWRYGDV